MIIRDAVYDDIDNIAKLYISNWKETYKGLLSEEEIELIKSLPKKIRNTKIGKMQKRNKELVKEEAFECPEYPSENGKYVITVFVGEDKVCEKVI